MGETLSFILEQKASAAESLSEPIHTRIIPSLRISASMTADEVRNTIPLLTLSAPVIFGIFNPKKLFVSRV
jgi:hypothetical protein